MSLSENIVFIIFALLFIVVIISISRKLSDEQFEAVLNASMRLGFIFYVLSLLFIIAVVVI